ncbi:hypothetical protein COCC4DRAFT_131826 [Bipolaris maydis ATCC 48331]|uniref:Major facilitator superfamily (MFS) profile domain-containing protein n=1 Tax=Cochliobolus heterostrophus (strain C4 / ATCC 48331 / race T) TaxID=665024 RepID=N4XQK0_COCH4
MFSSTKSHEEDSKLESQRIPHWKMILEPGFVTREIAEWSYRGAGTTEDPYIVEWIENDPRNPMEWSSVHKWILTVCMGFATLSISLASSAYSGGIEEIRAEFRVSGEVATLGLSLFVLGFACGPLLWAPFSELYGRQPVFFGTFLAFVAFSAGAAGSQNIWTLLILRFFASGFGSSPLTNGGGVIADLFPARQRGLAMTIFTAAPTMGPVIGPIVGGFLGMTEGWRWIQGVIAIFSGVLFFVNIAVVPETYAPVLLRKRAQNLSKMTSKVYVSIADAERNRISLGEAILVGTKRPWMLLFREPIVFLLSLYAAIVYGTLYMFFAAYPIVYRLGRGWNAGISGLPFIGIAIGMMGAMAYTVFYENKRYIQCMKRSASGFAAPEDRLPPAMVGGIALPIGLFWFAWTNSPSLPWATSATAGIPFGFGIVMILLSIMNYLIDAYTIFAASALAANNTLRSAFGAAFPLFTTQMYSKLGIHWASSIPAFLAVACLPLPFIFYKYGATIRKKCVYAAQADEYMQKIRG